MTMSSLPDPAGTPAKKSRGALLPAKVKPAVITVASFGLLITLVQVVNSLMSNRLSTDFGLVSRSLHGLIGVITAPLLHVSWAHLLSNLVPLLIFGFLIMLDSVRQFVAVTILVWLIAGLGVWVVGPANTVTVGASGLVFGWLAYLVTRGVFTRNFGQIAIGLVLLVIWGGVFWTGIVKVAVADISGVVTISWQGHLFGAIGGVLAAFLVAKADGPHKPKEATPALSQGF
ncbi:membrane associated rhomboid family serine protease [Nakamurella sp. UYEF19]|uniref:rhomboid family intramembrane serine protease n=1 Tax=Nakamurella sp. UYEF19 TaxID=1756392 RepID=UPI00339A7E69